MSASSQWKRDPNSTVTLRDYQHASTLYLSNNFNLAPKVKFLYYAVFNLSSTITNTKEYQGFVSQNQKELNYLVKEMDLPKYTLNTTNLNQYNRKTNVYTRITYEPLTFKFHDDNAGVSNALWALYYGYYVRDRLNSTPDKTYPEAYQRTTYAPKSKFPYRYGLDNDSTEPFFNSIQLFTLTRGIFFSYLLCNPKITTWQHDTMDQSQGNGVVENTLTVAYDAVIYGTGKVAIDNPSGFAQLYYDNTPGPLQYIGTDQARTSTVYGNTTLNSSDPNAVQAYNNLTGNRAPYGSGQPNLTTVAQNETQPVNGLSSNYMLRKSGTNTNTTGSVQAVNYQAAQTTDTSPLSSSLKQQQTLSDHSGNTPQFTDAFSSDFSSAANTPQTASAFNRESQYFNKQNNQTIDSSSGNVDLASVNVNGRTVSNKSYIVGNNIVEKATYVDNTQELLANNVNPDIPTNPFS